jgi:hypothetical protein
MKSKLIHRKPPSKRTPVTEHQARFLATLIDQLESALLVHFEVRSTASMPYERFQEIWKVGEYRRFVDGAYACGFVCRDFKPDFPFESGNHRPEETIRAWTFHELRHYIHTLLRAERWADGYSSPILEAVMSGALREVAKRLESDESLYNNLF